MVTTGTADELERFGIAAFRLAVNDPAGWRRSTTVHPSAGSSQLCTAASSCGQLRHHGQIDVFVGLAGTDAVEDAIAR